MTKRFIALAVLASLALGACGGSDSGTSEVKNGLPQASQTKPRQGSGVRTKNAALPATTAPVATIAPSPTAIEATRREVLGSFDEKTLTFTFTKPIPRFEIIWYDDAKQSPSPNWERMNATSVELLRTNYRHDDTHLRANLNFYFGATKVSTFLMLPQVPGFEKGPCSFRFEINNITPCIPVSGAVYQWFDDFKAIGDPQTLTFPTNAPASTVNFWKLGPPAGTTRVKARFTFARGGGTEDAYFNVYMFKNDIITTSRTGKIIPALIKGTDMRGMR